MVTILQCSREDLKKELTEIYHEIYIDAEAKAERNANEKLLSTKIVCDIFDIKPITLWRWAKEGYLFPVYVGGKKMFKRSEVNAIIDRGGIRNEK